MGGGTLESRRRLSALGAGATRHTHPCSLVRHLSRQRLQLGAEVHGAPDCVHDLVHAATRGDAALQQALHCEHGHKVDGAVGARSGGGGGLGADGGETTREPAVASGIGLGTRTRLPPAAARLGAPPAVWRVSLAVTPPRPRPPAAAWAAGPRQARCRRAAAATGRRRALPEHCGLPGPRCCTPRAALTAERGKGGHGEARLVHPSPADRLRTPCV